MVFRLNGVLARWPYRERQGSGHAPPSRVVINALAQQKVRSLTSPPSSGGGVSADVLPTARARPASQFLLSFLARQFALLSHRFIDFHRNPWLLWEPAEGSTGVVVARSAAETCLPGRSMNRAVAAGDALCFELALESLILPVR
jgi:hypothetical protein